MGQMSKEDLKRRIKDFDTKIWEDNLATKSTLKFYKEGKTRIGYEFCYRNNANSMFLARARTNSLKLEEAKGRGNPHYNKNCKLCSMGEEDLVHFTMVCPVLEGKRNYSIIDGSISDPTERMLKLLFTQKEHQEVGKMLKNLWNKRMLILKYINKDKDRMKVMNDTICSTKSDPGPKGCDHTPIERRSRSLSANRG